MLDVRGATDEEMAIVHQIMLDAFEEYRGALDPPSGAHTETLDDVRASAAEGGAILAILDGISVGSARYEFKADHVYCGRLAVLPTARGRGIGGRMLEFIHEVAKLHGYPEVRLSTREVMESNRRLYLRHGYGIVRRARHPKGGGIVLDFVKRIS